MADDGYESDYQPPVPFTLRMFAGGSIQYTTTHNDHNVYTTPLIGDICTRKSQLLEQPFIKHGKSGWLVFVSVSHKWYANTSDQLVLNEIQRYVYRTPPDSAIQSSNNNDGTAKTISTSNTTKSAPDYLVERTDIHCDEILLFRYSALTWNAHQIHYDYNWAKSEGYSGVLVHGPLQATLCIDTIYTYITSNNIGTLQSYEYRAQRPLVANTDITIVVYRSKMINDTVHEYTIQIIPRTGHDPAYFTSTAVVRLK